MIEVLDNPALEIEDANGLFGATFYFGKIYRRHISFPAPLPAPSG
jgi:hypothetical protein